MFTGIVEEMGIVQAIERSFQGVRLTIQASIVLEDAREGDSLSVNGCCLTVVSKHSYQGICDVVPETLERTNLKHLKVGDRINLERAVRYQDRLGGHLVQGHVDETGKILSKHSLADGSWWVTIEASPAIMRYVVLKGSIAIDGVSITVAELQNESFSFAMIPYTARSTTLGFKHHQDDVNLEVDLMAKYLERLINSTSSVNKDHSHVKYN